MRFSDIDAHYRKAIEASGNELAKAFELANEIQEINLGTNDITCAILLRLKSFYVCQENIKRQLNKIYSAPAADFFVESVCFFLKVVFNRLKPELTVFSEKTITDTRGSMRPDISIWREGELIAAIECKTQLGWNRGGWLHDFENREEKLHEEFPGAHLFLLVMTGRNWNGFDADDLRVGDKFFVLLNDIWPIDFNSDNSSVAIGHTIETLFQKIVKLVD